MKIVIDTNVVISGIFFNGNPRKVIESVCAAEFEAYASPEIIEEYKEIVDRIIGRGQGSFNSDGFIKFIADLTLIEPKTCVSVCRDPDDDKFINCAVDAKALYIVSGDSDLLDIKEYEGIEIITAADFVERYLLETSEKK